MDCNAITQKSKVLKMPIANMMTVVYIEIKDLY